MEKENLAADDDDGNKLELCADTKEMHNTESDLKNDSERCGHKVHRFTSEICDVHGSKEGGNCKIITV